MSTAAVVDLPKPKGARIVPLHPPRTAPAAGRSPDASAWVADVRQAITRGSFKTALDKAKSLHKRLASDETEAVLLEAYLARIQGMIAKNLVAEANALAELVVARYPQAAASLEPLRCTLAAKTGDLSSLLAPLATLPSPRQWPPAVLEALGRDVSDPAMVADCDALPRDHPLRVAATALVQALTAVTSGPVQEDAMALPEVTRKSPLADWKHLIRAIAALYEGRDRDCLQLLEAIDPASAVARLQPAMRSLLGENEASGLSPMQRHLVGKIAGGDIDLRAALEHLEAMLVRDDEHIGAPLSKVLRLCQQLRPDLLGRLKQHLFAKLDARELLDRTAERALRPLPTPDAYFWRLWARSLEATEDLTFACTIWEQFRRAAIAEGLFAHESAEEGILYLHMARQLRRLDPDVLADEQQEYRYAAPDLEHYFYGLLTDQDAKRVNRTCQADGAITYLYPERLYQRACRQRPEAAVFAEWLDFARSTEMSVKEVDKVAETWVRAFPEDHRPWLEMAKSAETRNAFTKALKYIGKAELLGGRDPATRVARIRLLTAKALRHLREEKYHLVPKDLEEIRAHPLAGEGDRPALIQALEWIRATMTGDKTGAVKIEETLDGLLGGTLSTKLLLVSVANTCDQQNGPVYQASQVLSKCKDKALIQALVRVCHMGEAMDVEIVVPVGWQDRLTKWFKRSACGLQMDQLTTVARAAMHAEWHTLVYTCTRHGLAQEGPHLPAFLLLRARCLPGFCEGRRQACLQAALKLARQTRQMELVTEILAARRQLSTARWNPFAFDAGFEDDLPMDDDTLAQVLGEERRLKRYPSPYAPGRYGKGPAWPNLFGRRKPPSGRGHRTEEPDREDPQMYLFDDLFEEDEAEYDEKDEAIDMSSSDASFLPEDFLEQMEELQRLNGGRPMTFENFQRILLRRPELAKTLLDLMDKYQQGSTR